MNKSERVRACKECQQKHHRCENVRPCYRCKNLNIKCVEAFRKKRKKKDTSTLTFTILNNEDLHKKFKKGTLSKIDALKNYNFKVDTEKLILSNFSGYGRIISLNFPKIDYVSPELLYKLKINKNVNELHLKDLIGESSYNNCIAVFQEEMNLKKDQIKVKPRTFVQAISCDTSRIITTDTNGEVFEMVKECIKIFKDDNPLNLEAVIIQLFWV